MGKHLYASRRPRIASWLVTLALAGVAACGDAGDGPAGGGGGGVVVGSIAIDGGNNQTGPAGGTLDVPLAVRIRQPDASPARDVTVRFRVVSGGARLLDEVAVTDFDGIARGTVILGTAEEGSRIVAEVRDDVSRSVTFDVTATAPPVLAALTPSSFGPGDTIRITGTGFGSNAGSAQVLFGAERGTVVPGSASATALRVVVPPCVASGSVPVTARVASVTTNALPGSASGRSAPLRLALYEAVTLPGAAVATCQPLDGNARYALLPHYAAATDFAIGSARDSVPSFPFQLGAAGAALPQVVAPRPPRATDPAMALHAFLRWQEQQLASEAATAYRQARGRLPEGVSLSIALAEVPTLGSTRAFQVLNSLTASPSTYSTVTARLVYAGANILVWLDQTAPTPTGVSDQTYVTLGRQFDEDLFPIDARTFGQPTDIDQNGRVHVLFTPVVNRLTADRTTCGSYIAGFFNGIDLVASSTRGNRGEIFYGSVPG
ncbi:MAG: IPT/TIG domain-containing protein, partial [Gemmatimonadaceae bacterium]|nr:IPT/TIG domain-containing protein [Gemmatimonadaceae bacterium]